MQQQVAEENFVSKHNRVNMKMRKFHNEELQDLYFSPDLIMVVKSSSMEWAGPGREENG
jgi:uncharacterized protein (DUF169 family)